MRVFVRVVEAGSFTKAAETLDISRATVTQSIQQLEAHLRIKLLNRTTRKVNVTKDGAAYFERVVKLLRASGRPVILVANKIDDARQEPEAAALWSLGLGEPHPVSAVHGRGVADLLDAAMAVLPKVSGVAKEEFGGPRRVALIGRPNVGKSSLLNKAVSRPLPLMKSLRTETSTLTVSSVRSK